MRLKILIIFLLIFVGYYLYITYISNDISGVVSDIDGKTYLVRDLPDKQEAANMIATIRGNIDKLSEHLEKNKHTKYAEYSEYIDQMTERIKDMEVSENAGNSVYTSYSINKGEQIIFCLRSKDQKDVMHNLNLIMYVVLHEISHVACPEYGHTNLFKKIFAFITRTAIEIDMYKRIDFAKDPLEYCGLMITDSII